MNIENEEGDGGGRRRGSGREIFVFNFQTVEQGLKDRGGLDESWCRMS